MKNYPRYIWISVKSLLTNMRYFLLFCSLALAISSCIKEKSIDTGATPDDPFDPTDTLSPVNPADTCDLVKFIQGEEGLGGDTIFVLHYNNQGRLFKIINSSDHSSSVDSFLYTYNGAGQVSRIYYDCPMPMDTYYEYSGNRLVKRKDIDINQTGDSAVFTYEYGSGNKPIRRNYYYYSSSSPVPGGFVGYNEYEYDAKGNITTINNFGGGSAQYKKATFTYLPQKNSFKTMAHISEAFNITDLENGGFPEMVWNENDLTTGVFLDFNGEIIKELHMNYVLDSAGRVEKVLSLRTAPGSSDVNTYNYRINYQCR